MTTSLLVARQRYPKDIQEEATIRGKVLPQEVAEILRKAKTFR